MKQTYKLDWHIDNFSTNYKKKDLIRVEKYIINDATISIDDSHSLF